MSKTLVVYYSRKGSNDYLAKKIARDLDAEIEVIKPRINVFFFFLFNLRPGIWKLKKNVEDFDHVILVSPIWMGRVIPPTYGFIKKYRNKIKKLTFVTCCGSGFEVKDDKFGHNLVFAKIREMLGDKLFHTEAFPIGLVLPEDKREDGELVMKTQLNDQNFNGEIEEIYQSFITNLKAG